VPPVPTGLKDAVSIVTCSNLISAYNYVSRCTAALAVTKIFLHPCIWIGQQINMKILFEFG